MEVYHDNENHDNEHQNDWKTFHGLKVHYIHHPRDIATNFQTFKPSFRVKMGAEFWKSLFNFSKVATKQSLEASTFCASSDCLVLMVTQIFDATFEKLNKPYFFQHCQFWHRFVPSTASSGPKSSCGPPSVLHEIDRLEQTNIHDMSEKFPPSNFMMKTASL